MKDKEYQINQSPLYKIGSHSRLANVLQLSSVSTVKKLVAKGSGNYYVTRLPSDRQIEVPLPQLARVHHRLNKLLTKIKTPIYLYSGVKGRSNVKNAMAHIGNTALLRIDIKRYYPSITEHLIEKCFVKSFHCTKDIARTLAKLCSINGHLPTGSTISQSLAFAVCKPVFDHINNYSKSRQIKFTCYVDDMTFSGKVIPQNFKDYICNYLKKTRGFKCHKIRVHRNTTVKVVTGVVIEGNTVKIRNNHRKKIQELLHQLPYKVKQNGIEDPKLVHFFQTLQGHLFSAGQVNLGYKIKGKQIVKYRQHLRSKVQVINSVNKNEKNIDVMRSSNN